MSRTAKWFRFLGRSPLSIIELIIAIASIVGGLYVASPLLVISTMQNGASPIVSMVGHPIGLIVFGSFLAFAGVVSAYGVIKRDYRFRSAGMFMIILARTYGLFGTFLIQGILPLTWLSSLVVLLICLVLYIWLRGLIARGLAIA